MPNYHKKTAFCPSCSRIYALLHLVHLRRRRCQNATRNQETLNAECMRRSKKLMRKGKNWRPVSMLSTRQLNFSSIKLRYETLNCTDCCISPGGRSQRSKINPLTAARLDR